MQTSIMTIEIRLPTGIFLKENNIKSLIAESSIGFLGILAHRLDCVVSLIPSILTYRNEYNEEKYVAIDNGVLIKTGPKIVISTRNAISGKTLDQLECAINEDFKKITEQELKIKQNMVQMENNLIKHLSEVQNEA